MGNHKPGTFLAVAALLMAAGAVAFAAWRLTSIRATSSFPDEESETYAVYSALISELFTKENVKLLVIQEQTLVNSNPDHLKATTPEDGIKDLKECCPSVDEDALKDYDTKNLASSKLVANFSLPLKYVLLNTSELHELQHAHETLREFSERYPGADGLISLSRVGFNKDYSQAYVRVEFIFCPLCSFGEEILLKKQGGTWKVAESFGGWVS